jgi:pentatricopeptide repeat protein
MKAAGIQPNEVTYSTLMNKVDNYESAKSVLDEMKAAGIQPNLLTYCTLFSKDINDYTIEDVHKWYLSETYNPSSALEPLIKRLFYEKKYQDAYYLILNYPHLESARKIVTGHLALSLSMYDRFKGKDFYEKNIDYALGIAYFDIGKSNKAIKHLKSAFSHAVAKKRSEHIKNLLKEIEIKSHQST